MSDTNARIGMICLTVLAVAAIVGATIVHIETGQPAAALLTLAGSAVGGLAGTITNGGNKSTAPAIR